MYQSIPNFNISSLGNPYYTYIHFYSNSFFHKFKKGIQYFKFQLVNIPIPQAKSDVQSLRSQSNAPTTGKKQVVEKRGGSQKGGGGRGAILFACPTGFSSTIFFLLPKIGGLGPSPRSTTSTTGKGERLPSNNRLLLAMTVLRTLIYIYY